MKSKIFRLSTLALLLEFSKILPNVAPLGTTRLTTFLEHFDED